MRPDPAKDITLKPRPTRGKAVRHDALSLTAGALATGFGGLLAYQAYVALIDAGNREPTLDYSVDSTFIGLLLFLFGLNLLARGYPGLGFFNRTGEKGQQKRWLHLVVLWTLTGASVAVAFWIQHYLRSLGYEKTSGLFGHF